MVALSTSSGHLSEIPNLSGPKFIRAKRWLLAGVSTWVGQTREQARELQEIANPKQIAVIPTPVVQRDPPPLNGEPRVLFAGRFAAEKNLFLLVEAWERIPRELGATLFLVGEGGRYRSIASELRRRVAASSSATSIQFQPWSSDLLREMSASDVFILPSLSEGMSNVLLEACTLGRVIVASRIESNVELLGDDYPFLFDPSEGIQLCDQLVLALTDETLRQKARRTVLDKVVRHSPTRVVQEIISAVANG